MRQFFVPGRICLFGEHSDWAGGYRRSHPNIKKGLTLICGTNQGLYGRTQRHPSYLVLQSTTPQGEKFGPTSISMQLDSLLQEANSGSFWSYAAGVAYTILKSFPVGGISIENYRTDLPLRKGLSSSAAVCVLVARAFNHIYELGLSVRDEMELAYQGEILTGSQCGRMDQGCAFGQRPTLMTFDGDQLYTQELTTGSSLHYVIVDLKASKDTRKILAALNACYPIARDSISEGVHALFGELNQQIITSAVEAMTQGNGIRLGALMTEAQALFDRFAVPACPEGLTAPVLHKVLEYPALQPFIWGGKGVGSQGDGTAQLLACHHDAQIEVQRIVERELGLSSLALTIETEISK